MAKKIIAVVGSTGAQGGGLARAILAGGEFALRAITRKPDSDHAKALAKQGAEIAVADLDDEASVRKAFTGAHGAFCLTNFWEHMSGEKELAQVEKMARAAKEAGIAHAVWSTLEDTRVDIPLSDARMPNLQGKFKVPHFDAKGEGNHFFADFGVPTTYLGTSFYWDNIIHFGMAPKKRPDGKYSFVLPMADQRLPGIAVEDIGKCTYAVFKRGNEFIGKHIAIAGECLTGTEMAAAMSRVLEADVVYDYVPPETYRTFGFPGADELGNMFQYNRDFASKFCGARDPAFARSLNPDLQTFAQFLVRHKAEIKLG